MKKLIFIIITVMLCLGTIITVFADESPSRYVDCIVTNPNGSILYNDIDGNSELITTTIPYNTKIAVSSFYDIRNNLPYTLFDVLIEKEIISEDDRLGMVTFNNVFGYINIDDVTIINDSFSLNNAEKIENPNTYIVTNEHGIPMFAGPSPLYDEIGTIPDSAEITLTYKDVGDEENRADTFYYTEYNGQGGWIFKNPGGSLQSFDLLRKLNGNSQYTGKLKVTGNNLRLFDVHSPEKDEKGSFSGYKKVSDAIPVGTELTFDSYYEYDNWAVVEYNGVKGCVALYTYPGQEDEIGIIRYINDDIMTKTDCTVFSDLNNFESETGEKVPPYSLLSAKAVTTYYDEEFSDWFLIEYNGKEVWICDRYNNEKVYLLNRHRDSQSYFKINTDSVVLYRTADTSSDAAFTVNKDDILLAFIDDMSMHYVEVVGSDKAGWINSDYIVPYSAKHDDYSETNAENESVNITSATNATDTTDPAAEIENTSNSSKALIIVCVVAAVVSVTAIIAIVIIKKKKKTAKN